MLRSSDNKKIRDIFNRHFAKLGCILAGIFLLTLSGNAEIRLPCLISNGMVLQRDIAVQIWGWAEPGEEILINFNDTDHFTVADAKGNWSVSLSPQHAGGPYDMVLKGNNTILVTDILVGDVWICSGQSNMEISLKRVEPLYPDEIAQSENPEIRYFEVPKKYDFKTPKADLDWGSWQHVNPQTAAGMSAVAYFFAKELNKKYGVPIGLINASLGGSPIEAWLSEEALKEFPAQYKEALRFRNDSLLAEIEASDNARIYKWHLESWEKDAGYTSSSAPWYSQDVDDSAWPVMNVPGYWTDTKLGAVNGIVWFRKEVILPESMEGKPAKLILGRIIDADSVWMNGKFIGSTSYQYPPRRYAIPANVLKSNRNIVVVRVESDITRGGFVPDKPYKIIAGDKEIELTGEWKFKLGAEMPPLQPQTFIRYKPEGLFNAMIAPLLNYTIKGVIWYQGESNTYNPQEYARLFPALISDWRQNWGIGDFPFLYVQLPNFMEPVDEPGESNWAAFRQVQLDALHIKNTGMAVTIDLGEWNDIHPLNKEDVGKRLALLAEKIAYGEQNIVSSGPLYLSMKKTGNRIILSFTSTGSGLMIKNGQELNQFSITGSDGKFVWANAKIEGNKVIVWSSKVKRPVAARYAWADNPVGANLFNKEGLPASPFETGE